MIAATSRHDEAIRGRLRGLSARDHDYWTFKGNSRRDHGHGFFQYPAMMVPQMVRAVLEEICSVHSEIDRIGDPFAGSGTILTESMLRGLSFSGTDINPLAVLLCRAKSGPFFPAALQSKTDELFGRIDSDGQSGVDVEFPGQHKWFKQNVQIELSKIRRAILAENSSWARRFFWIGLAEAVRLTSNSRTSTFKLHIRPEQEVVDRRPDPIGLFKQAISRNVQHLETQFQYLKEREYLKRGRYTGDIQVALGDSRRACAKDEGLCDVILTSPPYGDNVTTVPYGQYSYLLLHWLALSDIDPVADDEYLRSTHEIDTRSLGGSRRVQKAEQEALRDRSPAFGRCLDRLRDQPDDRAKRVTAFFRDLDACLDPILRSLRSGGLMIWTLGNRKVGGKRVPLDDVLTELLANHQASLLCTLTRRITSKRMASKNDIADTMSAETILVMRKAL